MKYLEVGADNQLQHPFFIQQVTFDGRGGVVSFTMVYVYRCHKIPLGGCVGCSGPLVYTWSPKSRVSTGQGKVREFWFSFQGQGSQGIL